MNDIVDRGFDHDGTRKEFGLWRLQDRGADGQAMCVVYQEADEAMAYLRRTIDILFGNGQEPSPTVSNPI